ncbi:hypothetical protein LXL04_012039 [Taraxacum kok-saghyz]
MSRFSKLDLIDYYLSESSTVFPPFPKPFALLNATFPFDATTELDLALDLLNPTIPSADDLDTITDLIYVERKTPSGTTTARKLTTRRRSTSAELYLQSLSDRVSALERGFDLVNDEKAKTDRKYTWTAEINSSKKDGLDRKFKLTTEIKGGKKKEKTSKWTAEIKKKGEDARKYTFTSSTANAAIEDDSDSEKKEKEKYKNKDKKKDKKKEKGPRIVEIQGSPDHGALLLKQAYDRRNKGKKKELSPQDAAMVIQMTFRAYLIKRSQSLRALRELAVAKAKLKELRALFNNFSYRRRVARDAEERQKFTEKVIVLLLTVDAIEGADVMVRAAKRSMVDELEAMLDVVDPQPGGGGGGGRSASMKRRTFDMPDGVIQKEIAQGVAEVVRMLGQEEEEE